MYNPKTNLRVYLGFYLSPGFFLFLCFIMLGTVSPFTAKSTLWCLKLFLMSHGRKEPKEKILSILVQEQDVLFPRTRERFHLVPTISKNPRIQPGWLMPKWKVVILMVRDDPLVPVVLQCCVCCFFFFFKKSFIFNWIIALQYCVGFCHTSAWISHRYTYVPSLLNLPATSHPFPPL